MTKFALREESQLKGNHIRIQGSKNAALPMMAASLLHRGVSVLEGMSADRGCFLYGGKSSELGAVTWWEDHDLYGLRKCR